MKRKTRTEVIKMAYTTVEDPVLIERAFEMRESGMYVSDIAKTLSEESGKRVTQMALWRLFEGKQKRQGQKKGDRNATPKPLCPKCEEYLKRIYVREVVNGKQRFVESGWACSDKSCDYVIKDTEEQREH